MNIIWLHGWKRYRVDVRSSGGSFDRLFHRMLRSMKDVLAILFTMLLAVTLVACDSNDDGDDDGNGEAETTQVRFVHASPDAGTVDIAVNGEVAVPDVAFNVGSPVPSPTTSGYQTIETDGGTTTLAVLNSDGNEVLSGTLDELGIEEGQRTTLIVAGAVANGGPQLIRLRDRFEDLDQGQIGLRLVHASAFVQENVGPVDVYLAPPGADLSNVTPLVSGFELGGDSGSASGTFPGFFLVQQATGEAQIVTVTPAGSTTAALEVPIGGSSGLPVQSGQFITGIAADVPDGSGGIEAGALAIIESAPEDSNN